jgi:hypothetical protein
MDVVLNQTGLLLLLGQQYLIHVLAQVLRLPHFGWAVGEVGSVVQHAHRIVCRKGRRAAQWWVQQLGPPFSQREGLIVLH